MKVAVVSPYAFDAHGGVQDQVARIVRWLRDDGVEAWAVAPGTGGPEGTRHVGGFVSWRANRSRAPIAINPAVIKRVAAAVEDADVVHIHEPLMPFVSLGALMSAAPPKVGTFHADPGKLARTMYRLGGVLVRRLLGRLGAVTAVSDTAASVLRPRVEPAIVPNGIDVTDYDTRDPKVSQRVVFLGRDDPRKGLDVLLDAWPGVMERFPSATLRCIGAEHAARPGVEFLGRVPEERKLSELGVAEVYVAPNRGGESFGIVVLEGMAAGCAVVASDIQPFRAVAGDAAVYVPVEDSSGISEAISTLLGDDDRRRRLGAAATERAARFDRATVLGQYRDAYVAALG